MRRRTRAVTAAMCASAMAAGGYLATRDAASAAPSADATTTTAKTSTAKVTKQDLVQTESFKGTLGYSGSRVIGAGAAGTITGLAEEGVVVNRGGALYATNESAVRLFYGTVPAYRTLGPNVSDGNDVKQVEANLAALGFADDDMAVDRDWTAATTRSVKAWQESLGVTESGSIELGSVVFQAGPVRIGEHKVAVGDAAQPGAPVVQVTNTQREVTVDLDADDSAIAALKDQVTVELSDGKKAKGTVSSIAAVAHTSEDGSRTVIPVVVTLTPAEARKLGSLDQAPVEVEFEKSRARGVLAVPVSALLALAEGGYAVEVSDAGGTRLVGVEIGAFADGRVEVSGDGLADGATVVVPA